MVKNRNRLISGSRRFYSRNQIRDEVRGSPDGYTGWERPASLTDTDKPYEDIVEKIKAKVAATIERV